MGSLSTWRSPKTDTVDEVRACRLLDGAGEPTNERPPTLLEAYSEIADNAIMDLELKVFAADCITDDPAILAELLGR